MFSSKNKKKTIGNAGFKSERVDGRNKMKGSVRKETNNLEEGSYGRKVLSKLATELEISCDGTFSCDKFDAKSCLKFQQFPQSNPLYKEVAKKADDWSKVVKFNMMVDNHGDKERAGAPSKAMRTFLLVFNGRQAKKDFVFQYFAYHSAATLIRRQFLQPFFFCIKNT